MNDTTDKPAVTDATATDEKKPVPAKPAEVKGTDELSDDDLDQVAGGQRVRCGGGTTG